MNEILQNNILLISRTYNANCILCHNHWKLQIISHQKSVVEWAYVSSFEMKYNVFYTLKHVLSFNCCRWLENTKLVLVLQVELRSLMLRVSVELFVDIGYVVPAERGSACRSSFRVSLAFLFL